MVEDSEFDIDLALFRTVHPLNAIIRRNKIFLDKSSSGFWFNINCNYPEADLEGIIWVEDNNITMSTWGEGFLDDVFSFYGPESVIFRNNTMQFYTNRLYFVPLLDVFIGTSTCNPSSSTD